MKESLASSGEEDRDERQSFPTFELHLPSRDLHSCLLRSNGGAEFMESEKGALSSDYSGEVERPRHYGSVTLDYAIDVEGSCRRIEGT
jgi:hypothetical protein